MEIGGLISDCGMANVKQMSASSMAPMLCYLAFISVGGSIAAATVP